MYKEPFVITLGNEDLPNLATDTKEDFGIEFSKTKLWDEQNVDLTGILNDLTAKLDIIIALLEKIGKE